MVAKMKKITFLIFHQEYTQFLEDLRELGLVHVVQNKVSQEESKSLELFNSQFKQLSEAEKVLKRLVDKKNPLPTNPADAKRGNELPKEIERIQNERMLLVQQQQVSIKERDAVQPWGNFDPNTLTKLEKAGYYVQFFTVSDNAYKTEWETLYNAIVIEQLSSRKYFVTVSKNPDVAKEIGLDPVKLPDVSLEQLNELIADLQQKIAAKDNELVKLTDDLPSLRAALQELRLNIDFTKVEVSASRVAEDKVMLLQGWAPEEKEQEIVNYLQSKNAYFVTENPEPEDDVPIQFKNKKFFSFFEPIAELYMLPKYNEIDLTPYFAPFYMLFFGLSLGDIGYGLFLLLVATIVKITQKQKLANSTKGILSLVQVLGASTMVAGLLTGGFFGFSIYDLDNPIAQGLKDKVFLDNNKMFLLSLVLGVIQILFGMVLKVFNRIKQFSFVHALSTIGWIILLVSFIVSALFKNFMPMFSTSHWIILAPALILIFFFNSPGKNPFLNFGLGLWDTYNMATGLLGDVLSYVRLFALGLSGGILASVFNSLAAGMSPDNAIIKPIVFVLIFLIGHAINIFMNVLGAIVHPVRLTFVEFYKNAEFEGGGKKYNPFKK